MILDPVNLPFDIYPLALLLSSWLIPKQKLPGSIEGSGVFQKSKQSLLLSYRAREGGVVVMWCISVRVQLAHGSPRAGCPVC